jgi:Protein of unknown function (DUF3570)
MAGRRARPLAGTPGLVGLLVVALGGAARADTDFASKIQVYTDTDHTSVVSPVVSAQADVAAGTNVSLGYLADVVTSASIDIVTQASPTTIHDTRHQFSSGVSQVKGPWTFALHYLFSSENDYLSHNLSASVDRTMFDKNTTFTAGYALSLNTVGRSGDMNFGEALTVQSLSVAWTQVVSKRFITQLTYELGDAQGYQASPYRFVPVRSSFDTLPQFWVPETDPDARYRHAFVIAANHAVFKDSAVQADYRLYHDTWGITSHTIGLRYYVNFNDKVELRLRNRFYSQNGATFYQDNYDATQMYMTIDRELSPLWSETVGGKLMVELTNRIEGEAKVDVFYYHYNDFPYLLQRTGANLGVGLTLTY